MEKNIFESYDGIEFRLKLRSVETFRGHLNKDGAGENVEIIEDIFGNILDEIYPDLVVERLRRNDVET